MARLIYYDQFITQKPREITREQVRTSIVCDLHTILKRLGVYSYYSPGRRIDPTSDEGLRICARLGMQPISSQPTQAAT